MNMSDFAKSLTAIAQHQKPATFKYFIHAGYLWLGCGAAAVRTVPIEKPVTDTVLTALGFPGIQEMPDPFAAMSSLDGDEVTQLVLRTNEYIFFNSVHGISAFDAKLIAAADKGKTVESWSMPRAHTLIGWSHTDDPCRIVMACGISDKMAAGLADAAILLAGGSRQEAEES